MGVGRKRPLKHRSRPCAVVRVRRLKDRNRLGAAGQESHANGCGRRYLTLAGSSGGCPLYLGTCPSVRRSGWAGQRLGDDVRPTTAPSCGELVLPTHRSRRRSSRRTADLPWNLTFAHAVEEVVDDDSGPSRMPTGNRNWFVVETLYRKVTDWRCRSDAVSVCAFGQRRGCAGDVFPLQPSSSVRSRGR